MFCVNPSNFKTVPTKWILKWRVMEDWKVLPATMLGQQEKYLNSRHSWMAKTLTFWLWWQPFNSFCFETVSFFPLFPLLNHCLSPSLLGVAGPVKLKFIGQIYYQETRSKRDCSTASFLWILSNFLGQILQRTRVNSCFRDKQRSNK